MVFITAEVLAESRIYKIKKQKRKRASTMDKN